jgi:GTP cyclohydrolase II
MYKAENLLVTIPTKFGVYYLRYYYDKISDKEHLALVMGDPGQRDNVLTRVHSECLTGDVFGSRRCDCGEQLERSMQLIGSEGLGIVIYLRQEGRGIGLIDKLRAYKLQEQGYDTVDANVKLGHQVDERNYDMAVHILNDLQVRSVNLMTNNPLKVKALREAGINITQVTSLQPTVYDANRFYLQTKVSRMGHNIILDSNSSQTDDHK